MFPIWNNHLGTHYKDLTFRKYLMLSLSKSDLFKLSPDKHPNSKHCLYKKPQESWHKLLQQRSKAQRQSRQKYLNQPQTCDGYWRAAQSCAQAEDPRHEAAWGEQGQNNISAGLQVCGSIPAKLGCPSLLAAFVELGGCWRLCPSHHEGS